MSKANGFTLIELLAAMVAGSLLLASLSWSIATLGRELRASDRQSAGSRIHASAPLLTGLIEHMLPTEAGGAPINAEADRLSFDTIPPAALAAAGAVRASFAVRPYEQGEALFIQLAPAAGGPALPAPARSEQRLTEAHRSIAFAYSEAPADQQGAPPRLVSIRFTDISGRARTIVLAPRLNGSGDCRFDPISMECRR